MTTEMPDGPARPGHGPGAPSRRSAITRSSWPTRSRPRSSLCPWLTVERVGDNVVARTELGRNARVLLAGHLDTVPPVGGNEEPRLEDGVLFGVGAADMKGGLAVFLHLAGAVPEPAVDVTWCFYVCEEVEQEFNGLSHALAGAARPSPGAMPPSSASRPAGSSRPDARARCGSVCRSAAAGPIPPDRPAGRNAIHRLAPVLTAVAGYESRRPVLDGCEYVEQLQAVEVDGGVAANVVPDEASLLINHRFAPDRTVEEAESSVTGAARTSSGSR